MAVFIKGTIFAVFFMKILRVNLKIKIVIELSYT